MSSPQSSPTATFQFIVSPHTTVVQSAGSILYRSSHSHLFRYDKPQFLAMFRGGSVRVTTLNACRNAEGQYFGDAGEGTKVTTSLPGGTYLDSTAAAKLLGIDPQSIKVVGNGFFTGGSDAVVRPETMPDAFIFCTSALEEDDYMKSTFGECSKITDPVSFFGLVDRKLREAIPHIPLGPCVVADVEYAPRTNNYRDHTEQHIAFIKPSDSVRPFQRESEVRALWIPERNVEIQPVILTIPEVGLLLE